MFVRQNEKTSFTGAFLVFIVFVGDQGVSSQYGALCNKNMKQEPLTRSSAEPPPKYSIMIHNFVSWNVGDREREESEMPVMSKKGPLSTK